MLILHELIRMLDNNHLLCPVFKKISVAVAMFREGAITANFLNFDFQVQKCDWAKFLGRKTLTFGHKKRLCAWIFRALYVRSID